MTSFSNPCLEKRQVSYEEYVRRLEHQRYLREYELLQRETERRRQEYYDRLRRREEELRRQQLRMEEEMRRRYHNDQMAMELRLANNHDLYMQELRRREEMARRDEEIRRRQRRLLEEQRRYDALALTQNNGSIWFI